jgi:hypothetical protein
VSLAPHSSDPILSPSPLLFSSIGLEAICLEMWKKPPFAVALFKREGSPRLRIYSKTLCARSWTIVFLRVAAASAAVAAAGG